MFSSQCSRFSLICIALLFESFWTALSNICVSCMRWINSSALRSVLWDLFEVLCLRFQKCLILCSLLLFWLLASFYSLRCVNLMILSKIWIWNVIDICLWEWRKEFPLQHLDFFFKRCYHVISIILFQQRKLRKLFSWLSILAHFAKHHINFNALLSSCICDLKCAHFVCLMILFLWSLCFRYSFHVSNVLNDEHK